MIKYLRNVATKSIIVVLGKIVYQYIGVNTYEDTTFMSKIKIKSWRASAQ